MNFVAALEWSNTRHADKIALTTPDVSRTFAEIDERANALAHALVDLGVSKGDRVGICISNRIEFAETEWAVAKAGAARVPILTTSAAKDIEYYVDFARPRVIVASDTELDTIRAGLAGLGDRASDIALIAAGGGRGEELDYETLIAGSPRTRLGIPLTEDDLYAIRFTGGTTGLPKGVMMSHRSVMGMVNNMLLSIGVQSDDVICHFHPLSHAAGMLMATWWMRGAHQVILPAFGFDAEKLLEVIERERVTTIFTIPTALNVLLDSPTVRERDTSSLRRIYYGGAPISPRRIAEALDVFGPILTQVYGHSESPMVLATLDPEDHVFRGEPPARLASCGRPIYNVEVRLLNEDGNDCAVGELGEIVSRGDQRFVGYWDDPHLSQKKVLDGGWVRSGDVGRWDEGGYLYLVDRHDDMVITGGFNVWPAEVENVICAHPAVGEGVVVGLPHDHWGEVLTAVVVLRAGEMVEPAELMEFCRGQLPAYKVPKQVFIQDTPLPKSGVDKLLRRVVRDQYAAADPIPNPAS